MVTTKHSPTSIRNRGLLRKLLGFPVLLGALTAFAVFLLVPHAIEDPDIWWHLRNAEYLLGTHAFLRRDLYSYTAKGALWINHEWLAEIPYYLAWRALGPLGLFLVSTAVIEAIFTGLFLLTCRYAGTAKAALPVCLVAAILATISFGPRTLLFGWLCLVVELHLLQCLLERNTVWQRRAAFLLPWLFALWINLHGSWLIGMALLAIFIAGGWVPIHSFRVRAEGWTREQKRMLAGATFASVACLFVNPYGWRLVSYPFDLAFRQKLNIANVEEWATLDFHSPRGRILMVVLMLLFLAQLLRGRTWAPYELGHLAVGAYASFTYSRFLFLAGILVCPLLAREMPAISPYMPEKDKPWLNALVLFALTPFAYHHLLAPAPLSIAEGRAYPDAALPFLKTFKPEGRVLNDLLWGGYLEWNLRTIPTFADTRIDLFERNGTFADYLDLIRLKGSLSILDKYRIRYVLFDKRAALVYLLRNTGRWKVDYEDGTTILLERISAVPQG